MKISYNPVPFGAEPVEKSIERLARYGWDGIELISEPDIMDSRKIKGCLQQYGICASSIGQCLGKDRDLISSFPEFRRAEINYVKRTIDIACTLDADVIIVAPSRNMKRRP